MEFQRTGCYDLMYMKTKELGWKDTQGIQNMGIEDPQGNRIAEQSQVLKIWENYITELHDRPNRPETLDVELEEEVDTDERGPYILQSEVEKAIKEMRNKKAAVDDDVSGDVLKLLGEGDLKIMTKLINTIYETGEWPKDFTEITMIALKEKPQATKCSDHRTVSFIAHTTKILRRRIEKKIKDVLGDYNRTLWSIVRRIEFVCENGSFTVAGILCPSELGTLESQRSGKSHKQGNYANRAKEMYNNSVPNWHMWPL